MGIVDTECFMVRVMGTSPVCDLSGRFYLAQFPTIFRCDAEGSDILSGRLDLVESATGAKYISAEENMATKLPLLMDIK